MGRTRPSEAGPGSAGSQYVSSSCQPKGPTAAGIAQAGLARGSGQSTVEQQAHSHRAVPALCQVMDSPSTHRSRRESREMLRSQCPGPFHSPCPGLRSSVPHVLTMACECVTPPLPPAFLSMHLLLLSHFRFLRAAPLPSRTTTSPQERGQIGSHRARYRTMRGGHPRAEHLPLPGPCACESGHALLGLPF